MRSLLSRITLAFFVFSSCTSIGVGQSNRRFSTLWGQNGEAYSPSGRLPDFSYAGYAAGEQEIPTVKIVSDLKKDFGAKGDGTSDDSDALALAVKKSPPGAILIPAGTYRIEREIKINRSGVILRGEGTGKSILFFSKSLTDLKGNRHNPSNEDASEWSFGPGMLVFKGDDPIDESTLLVPITGDLKRGDKNVSIAHEVTISPGEWIRIVESDPKTGPKAGSLVKFFLRDLMIPGPELIGTKNIVRFLSRVTRNKNGILTLERPLPVDVRAEWAPQVHRFAPYVQNVGIENLTIVFPPTRYPGHFKELGYNGITFSETAQCWVRNVEILNADFALEFRSTNFCTADNVVLAADPMRSGERNWSGHHGFEINHGTENLIQNFEVKTRFVHDVSYEWYSLHTVVSHGTGVDMNLDFHRESPYENLATDLDLGEGTRPFASGGDKSRGPHTAAYATFWNLRAKHTLQPPAPDFGPLMNFVGLRLNKERLDAGKLDWFYEDIDQGELMPPNLYKAQLINRIKIDDGK